MKHIERIQKYVRKNWLYLLPSVIFIFVSIVLIAINRSFIFEREFISQYGDQQLYYKLARGVLNGEFPKKSLHTGLPNAVHAASFANRRKRKLDEHHAIGNFCASFCVDADYALLGV